MNVSQSAPSIRVDPQPSDPYAGTRTVEARPVRPPVRVEPQPTDSSCGPTCLQAVYRHFGLEVDLAGLIERIPSVPGGGTLAVMLGVDALRRGFAATLQTCNLRVLDPTWFPAKPAVLAARIEASLAVRRHRKERQELQALREFIDLGGEVRMEPLTRELLRQHLVEGCPVLTGLSATFLYRDRRVNPATNHYDDLGGDPQGHFVVLSEYNRGTKQVTVHDPWPQSPFDDPHRYHVHIDRLINAILLGVLTFDANLLAIKPGR